MKLPGFTSNTWKTQAGIGLCGESRPFPPPHPMENTIGKIRVCNYGHCLYYIFQMKILWVQCPGSCRYVGRFHPLNVRSRLSQIN